MFLFFGAQAWNESEQPEENCIQTEQVDNYSRCKAKFPHFSSLCQRRPKCYAKKRQQQFAVP